jgi:hypothetical protein
MPEVRVSCGQAADQYRALGAQLRQGGRTDLRRQLRGAIVKAGQPVLQDVRTAVRNINSTSTGGGGTDARRAHAVSRARADKAKDRVARRDAGLRESIARATKLQVTQNGVRFVVQSTQLPADQSSLPRHLDSVKGWRHPVFGNRQVWVTQHGEPWFASTLKEDGPKFRAEIVDAIAEFTEEFEA